MRGYREVEASGLGLRFYDLKHHTPDSVIFLRQAQCMVPRSTVPMNESLSVHKDLGGETRRSLGPLNAIPGAPKYL